MIYLLTETGGSSLLRSLQIDVEKGVRGKGKEPEKHGIESVRRECRQCRGAV